MDIRNVFWVTKEVAELARKYEDVALETSDPKLKQTYMDFVSKLDDIDSNIEAIEVHNP